MADSAEAWMEDPDNQRQIGQVFDPTLIPPNLHPYLKESAAVVYKGIKEHLKKKFGDKYLPSMAVGVVAWLSVQTMARCAASAVTIIEERSGHKAAKCDCCQTATCGAYTLMMDRMHDFVADCLEDDTDIAEDFYKAICEGKDEGP